MKIEEEKEHFFLAEVGESGAQPSGALRRVHSVHVFFERKKTKAWSPWTKRLGVQ